MRTWGKHQGYCKVGCLEVLTSNRNLVLARRQRVTTEPEGPKLSCTADKLISQEKRSMKQFNSRLIFSNGFSVCILCLADPSN